MYKRQVPTEELYDYERFKPEGKYAVGLWRYSKPPPGQYAVCLLYTS